MKKKIHLPLSCLLLFSYCLEAESFNPGSIDANISKKSAQEFLVSFSPAITLESGESCWGVRVSDGYIATSSDCGEEMKNRSASDVIRILDLYDLPVGEVTEIFDNTSV